MIMEICNNIKTGQTFLYLEEEDSQRGLMITPNGTVKSLEMDLFTEPHEVEQVDALLDQGKITDAQLQIYDQYRQT